MNSIEYENNKTNNKIYLIANIYIPIHSPKSSRESKPSLASLRNLDSTFLHNSSESQALVLVLVLMNLSPLRACCAFDRDRWRLALILRASRADMIVFSSASSSEAVSDALVEDLSHGNFRRILDVIDRFLSSRGGCNSSLVGVTLHTTTESSSSSSVTSTKSCELLLCRPRPLRNIGSIAPPPQMVEPSRSSSGRSNDRR